MSHSLWTSRTPALPNLYTMITMVQGVSSACRFLTVFVHSGRVKGLNDVNGIVAAALVHNVSEIWFVICISYLVTMLRRVLFVRCLYCARDRGVAVCHGGCFEELFLRECLEVKLCYNRQVVWRYGNGTLFKDFITLQTMNDQNEIFVKQIVI
jgi:hypothetical protein